MAQIGKEVQATEAVQYFYNFFGFGYKVFSPFWEDGECALRFITKRFNEDGSKTFLPDIEFSVTDGVPSWGINAPSFGTLHGDDIMRWIKANEYAVSLVRAMQKNETCTVFDLPEIVD